MRTTATLAAVLAATSACLVLGDDEAKAPPSLALLVGCTKYTKHDGLRQLYGPANDVPLWAATLTDPKGFAFPEDGVTRLVGWPDDEAKRPTHANIVKGFESLIQRARPGSRVVILLAGHGIQVPIPTSQKDPLDPKNPEPDGLDEVFLPADVEDWTETAGLKNALLDDQIGAWLDRLREKGAHVLIAFDCCHSGTMTRGGPGVREISRVASPEQLKIDPKAIDAAVARATAAVEAARRAGKAVPTEVVAKEAGRRDKGSLVAFYAAQSFEEAPELPFPEDAPLLRENYYGMLSWTLVQTLKGRQGPLSYGELQRLVGAKYRASRGTRPPSPFAEGDLDREVLGMRVWPQRPAVFVQKDKKGKLTLDAGSLQGVTAGSIFAIGPPPGDRRPADAVLAHVRVRSAGPAAATVVPVRRGEKGEWADAPQDAAAIPDAGRAGLVVRDVGELKIEVFAKGEAARKALDALDGRVGELIRRVDKEQDAAWLLVAAGPDEAERSFGARGLKGEHVLLVHGEGKERQAKDAARKQPRKVYGAYPAGDGKALAGALEIDLPKVFKWESLWRVAAAVGAADGGEDHGLEVRTLKQKDEDDEKGELLRDGVLRDGQEVMWRASNKGKQPLWVTAFYLDANLGIQVVYSAGVGDGKTVRLARATVTTKGGSVGQEGMVVFAVPQAAVAVKPDFSVLEQEPLRVRTRAAKPPGGGGTPFHALLDQAAHHKGTRGIELRVRTTPAIVTQSWVVLP